MKPFPGRHNRLKMCDPAQAASQVFPQFFILQDLWIVLLDAVIGFQSLITSFLPSFLSSSCFFWPMWKHAHASITLGPMSLHHMLSCDLPQDFSGLFTHIGMLFAYKILFGSLPDCSFGAFVFSLNP